MRVVPLGELDPDGVAAALIFRQRADRVLNPRVPPTTRAEFDLWIAGDHSGGNVHERAVVFDESGAVRALGHLELQGHEANRHFASAEIPGAAGDRHAGHVALAPMVARASEDGRTTMDGWGPLTEAEGRFWTELGGRLVYVDQESTLELAAVDPEMMQAWVDQRMERAADVELVCWTGLCPEEFAEAYAVSRTAMNDAPTGELDINHEAKDPAGLEKADASRIELGTEIHVLFAVDPDGAPVGHTAVHVNSHRPAASWQWDTVVLAGHRRRGVGRWLKAAMWQYLREAAPEVTHLTTGNAADNDPMLSINRAMGFVPTTRLGSWQADLDTFRRALGGPGQTRASK